jgi:hypothetical protein
MFSSRIYQWQAFESSVFHPTPTLALGQVFTDNPRYDIGSNLGTG